MRHVAKKHAVFGSALGVVLASLSSQVHGQNLLTNPGFESPADTSGQNTDTTITGWSLYGGDTVRANFQNHTPGGEWSIWEQTFNNPAFGSGVYQRVSVPSGAANTTYTLSGYYYFESAFTSIPNETSDLALTFLNSSNQPIGTTDSNGFSDAVYIASNSVTTGSWLPYTVSGVAPAGTASVQVNFDFYNGSTVTGQQAAFVDDASLIGVGTPPTVAQWAVNNSGDWNVNGNWTTGSIPNGPGLEADFFGVITSNNTVYTNTADTVGIMHFNNAKEYVIAGAGSLTLQATTGGSALIQVDQGTDILDIPTTFASNTTLNVAANATLVVANPITINSGTHVMQSGAGTVTYQSLINVLSGGSLGFLNATHAHQLTLASTATATVGGSGTVLTLDSLSNSGTLDVQKNAVIINYGSGADPISTIKAEIASGYNGGAWNGTGITSSSLTAGTSYAIGYADSADPGNPAGLASGTIEILYTLLGDANLDGKVNGADFAILATNFNKAVGGWDQGDFNYDGKANGADFAGLAANFNKGTTIAVSEAALSSFAQANGLSLSTSVPEPASAALAGVAALGLLRRRRKD